MYKAVQWYCITIGVVVEVVVVEDAEEIVLAVNVFLS